MCLDGVKTSSGAGNPGLVVAVFLRRIMGGGRCSLRGRIMEEVGSLVRVMVSQQHEFDGGDIGYVRVGLWMGRFTSNLS